MRFRVLLFLVLTIQILSFTTFAQVAPAKVYDFHHDDVNAVSFSPDSKFLASASDDGTVNIIDLQTGSIRLILKDHNDKVSDVEFSRDGKNLFSVSRNKIIINEIGSFQKIKDIGIFLNIESFRVGTGNIVYFFAQRGVESTSSFYRLNWETLSYTSVQTTSTGISDYVVSEDGKYLFFAKGKNLNMLDLSTNQVIKKLQDDSKIFAIDVDANSKQVLTSMAYGMTNWAVDAGRGIPYKDYYKSEKIYLGANADFLAFIEKGNLVLRKTLAIQVTKINTGSETIKDFSFNKTEELIASVSQSSAIKIWNNPLFDPSNPVSVTSSSAVVTSQGSGEVDLNNIYSRGELTEPILMGLYGSRIQADLDLSANLFAPKDEFEKTTDYNARVAQASELKARTLDNYRDQYAADVESLQQQESIEAARKLALIQEKIRASYRSVTFPIQSVGTYDADNETYPITINGETQSVKMPPGDARTFKANLTSADAIGYQQLAENGIDVVVFNLFINHPISRNTYEFGLQKEPLFLNTPKQSTQAPATTTATTTAVVTTGTPTPSGVSNNVSDDANLVYELGQKTNYALIIAVEDYLDDEINDLENPIKDANALIDVLTEKYTFKRGNIQTLQNPTRAKIISAFDLFATLLKPNDNLVIFYAGHGIWDEQLEQGYWLPSDANDDSKSEWLSNGTIRDYIRGINSKHTLLIADACFSGGIFRTRSAFNESKPLADLYNFPSRKALTSGALNTVPDKSVFMEYLIKRLGENNEEIISTSQLFTMFRDAVVNNSVTGQVPQYGDIREAGDEGGDFIFVTK